jgi:hypothetical protein
MRISTCLVLGVALLGCNDNGGGGGGGTDMTGGGGGGGDMAGQPSGDMALGPGDVVLNMEPFMVPAGGEVFRCQNFANPFGGEAEIREWESEMTPGSHHLLLFYQNNATNGPLETCSGLEFKSGPYGAQSPHAKITYPAGVAAGLGATQGLRFASHYLNASPNAIMAQVKVIIRRAQPGTVMHRAGVFFFNNIFFANPIPKAPDPNNPPEVQRTKTCKVPRDVNIIFATGHMHQWATNLTATVNGNVIYSTDSWDNSPFAEFAPPLFLKANTDVTWTCTYKNTTNGPLTFGESANNNEMCIFDGQFYPDPGGNGFGC